MAKSDNGGGVKGPVAELNPERRMHPDELTGVLDPVNLVRYDARWIEPAPDLDVVVDQYWTVSWNLERDEFIDQAVIDLPAVSLSIEEGDVPAPLVITGLHRRAWFRRIQGNGQVFAVRLRPAGLAVLSSLRPADLANRTLPVTPGLDPGLHELMQRISKEQSVEARAGAANVLIREQLARKPPPESHRLANGILAELRSLAYHRASSPLTRRFGVSERTIQRAMSATLGIGPKQALRRIRLQEAAQAFVLDGEDHLTEIAARLGFTDQAHLTKEFREATGVTPGAYRRTVRALMDL